MKEMIKHMTRANMFEHVFTHASIKVEWKSHIISVFSKMSCAKRDVASLLQMMAWGNPVLLIHLCHSCKDQLTRDEQKVEYDDNGSARMTIKICQNCVSVNRAHYFEYRKQNWEANGTFFKEQVERKRAKIDKI